MATTEQPSSSTADDERTARRARLQAGAAARRGAAFSNFAISFTIISVLAGLLHHLRPGVEQRRPDRDLVGLADHLRPDPARRVLDVRAGLGVPDRGRHLLVGVDARRPGLGLVHRLVQPRRPGRRRRLGRLRAARTFLYALAQPLRPRPRRSSTSPTRRTSSARRSCCSRFDPGAARADQHLLVAAGRAVQQHLRLVARARRRGDHRDPDLRPRPRTRASTSSSPRRSTTPASATGMFWFYVLPLGFLLTMYTQTGYDASAHISEETHGARRCGAAQGVWRSVFWSGVDRLDRAAGDHVRGHRRRRRSTTGRRLARWRSSTARCRHGRQKIVVLIATIGQLFCGMACVTSALAHELRVLARPRGPGLAALDAAQPPPRAGLRRARSSCVAARW